MNVIAECLSMGREPIDARPYEPRVMPVSWTLIRHEHSTPERRAWASGRGLLVLFSVARERDGKLWLHVSVSHSARLPNWEELRSVKDLFIGTDRKALQVFPAEAEYVNIHPRVLHLWSCLDGDPTPDFRIWNPFANRAEI
jgi:hypothetical protein